MIRKPTTNEFAYGAMLLGMFLFGIVVGVSLSNADKVREWIGALSGWAAAIAAGVTIVYLRGSLKTAQEQAEHAAQQTAIMSGELEPYLTYMQPIANHQGSCHRFHIYNDGKHQMRVLSVEVLSPNDVGFVPASNPNHLGIAQKDWPQNEQNSVKRVTTDFKLGGGFGKPGRATTGFNLRFFQNNGPFFGKLKIRAVYTLDGLSPNDKREAVCDEALINPAE